MKFAYPAVFEPAEEGGFNVSFPDFPEALTEGEDTQDAIEQAIDCIEEAVANRVVMNLDLPQPSRKKRGQRMIPVPAGMAITAALYDTIRRKKMTKVQLAAELGIDEKEVRRLLDPYHSSKFPRVSEVLERIGKRVVIEVEDIQKIAAAR